MGLLISLGLIYFFTSACQHLSATFKGTSAVVRWLLSVAFVTGLVVFVVCFIKSFFALSWWMPIVGLIVASVVSGVLQGLMDVLFAYDLSLYIGYSVVCIVGTLVSAIVDVVVFFKDTISHIVSLFDDTISHVVSLFDEWHNGLGYNSMNLYDLEDFFSVDMYQYYAHECNMCIIVLICITLLIISIIMLIAYGIYSDKRLLKRHFYLFSVVGIVGFLIEAGLAMDFLRPFIIVFVADFFISALLGGIIAGASIDKIGKEQYALVLFWDVIIILSSLAIGGCALASTVVA